MSIQRLNGISFSGYSKTLHKSIKNGEHVHIQPYYDRTSQELITGNLAETETKVGTFAQVYYADPMEKINEHMINSHSYIVKFKEFPAPISKAELSYAKTEEQLKPIIDRLSKRGQFMDTYSKHIDNWVKEAECGLKNAKEASITAAFDKFFYEQECRDVELRSEQLK